MRRSDPSSLLRAMFRSARFVALYQGAGLLVIGLSALPATRPLLGVGPGDVARGLGSVMLTNLAATWAFHARGEQSATYRSVALVELLTYQGAMMWLIYRSGSGMSLVWLMWLGQAAANVGIIEHQRALMTIYTASPLLLALGFWLRGDPTSAVASVLGAVVGAVVFSAGLRNNLLLAEASAQREAALAELTELRVRDERLRIARDLHDGVAADLSAMAMRADWARVAPADARERELALLAARSREAIDDLRTIVWSMRSPERTAPALAAYLEQRCREVCGRDLAFEMHASVDEALTVSGERALDAVRIAQECCRNAVRHASPSRVSVTLRIEQQITLTVEDDGTGLPEGFETRPEGGLANLRRRVEPDGRVSVHRLARGTRFEILLGRS